MSRDEHNPDGLVVAKRIEEVFERNGLIRELNIGGRVIRSTSEHPFFRQGDGWVPLGQIRVGDRLLGENGDWLLVEGVRDTGTFEPVYNFRVEDYHTYFVGCYEWGFAVWAHNIACTPDELSAATHEVLSTASFRGKGNLRQKVVEALQRDDFAEATRLLQYTEGGLKGIGVKRADAIVQRLRATSARPAVPTPVVPGGGLAAHEAAGGHTIARHVGKTDAELAARLAAEPRIPAASTFPDLVTAERAVADSLAAKSGDVAAWLAGTGRRMPAFNVPVGYLSGLSLPRGASATTVVNSVRVVLERDPSMSIGFKIITSYPVP